VDYDNQICEWMDLYGDRLVNLAYTFVRDLSAAEDRVQDAFIKAYRSMYYKTEIQSPFPWLAKIVINECKSSYRKRWREIITSIIPEKQDESTEETYLILEKNQKIYEAILSLPEKYRTPIILFYFEDLSIDQVSKVLGERPNTVKSQLKRGREKLRILLKEDLYGESNKSCEAPI
jgi:RNA polymerase sigma-70 factor (ECF subfamily)